MGTPAGGLAADAGPETGLRDTRGQQIRTNSYFPVRRHAEGGDPALECGKSVQTHRDRYGYAFLVLSSTRIFWWTPEGNLRNARAQNAVLAAAFCDGPVTESSTPDLDDRMAPFTVPAVRPQ